MRPSLDGRAWLQIVRETLPIAAASAIYGVYFRLVILMMSLLATDVETGVFAISFRVVEVLVMLPFLLVGSLLPLFSRAARDDQARLRFAFGRTLDAMIFAGAGLSVVTFAGAPLAVAILTGGGGETVEVLRIQALTLFAVFVDVAYGSLMISMRWHRELIVLNLITLAITVGAVFALVPDHGAHGGAIAATAGEYALLVGYVVCVRLRRPDLHPAFATLPRAALAAALAIAAAELVELPLPHDAAQPAIAAAVYLAAMWALRAIPVELTDALRPAVSRRP
jgi:O-antigen/teichoic acid export membrane protein